MKIEIDFKHTANVLKMLVNNQCVDGFKWFKDVPESVSANIFELVEAIRLLEEQPVKTITIAKE